MSKKSGFVPMTFRDAGTEETFEGGQVHYFETGAHANYLAAGLIEAPKAKAKPAVASAARPARASKPKARPAKTATPPATPAPPTSDAAAA